MDNEPCGYDDGEVPSVMHCSCPKCGEYQRKNKDHKVKYPREWMIED